MHDGGRAQCHSHLRAFPGSGIYRLRLKVATQGRKVQELVTDTFFFPFRAATSTDGRTWTRALVPFPTSTLILTLLSPSFVVLCAQCADVVLSLQKYLLMDLLPPSGSLSTYWAYHFSSPRDQHLQSRNSLMHQQRVLRSRSSEDRPIIPSGRRSEKR